MIDKIYIKKIRNVFTVIINIVLILNFFSVQASADDKVVQEVKNILNNYYVEQVPENILSKDSVNEIMTDLKDPYTQVMDQDEFNNIMDNTFFGIGVTIEMKEIGAEITSVMVSSPAMKAGLMEGDIVIAINDNIVCGLSGLDAINVLNSKTGEYNRFKVVRKNKVLIINITPSEVYYSTVYTKIVDKNIGYIHILSFSPNTLAEFEYKINSPQMRAANSYIFDLRNNPGGYLYSAAEIAGYFSRNNPVAIFQSKNGEKFDFKATKKNLALTNLQFFL